MKQASKFRGKELYIMIFRYSKAIIVRLFFPSLVNRIPTPIPALTHICHYYKPPSFEYDVCNSMLTFAVNTRPPPPGYEVINSMSTFAFIMNPLPPKDGVISFMSVINISRGLSCG